MEKEVLRDLERILQQYLNIAGTFYSLSISKQKIVERGLQPYDKELIAADLHSIEGKLQDMVKSIHGMHNRITEP